MTRTISHIFPYSITASHTTVGNGLVKYPKAAQSSRAAIQISNGVVSKIVNLDGDQSIGDVINSINQAAVGGITASLGGQGLSITGSGTDNITITDDVYHPAQAGAPFDGEGVPRQRLTLVENGVVKQVASSRQAAKKAGIDPTGHGFPLPNDVGEAPMNIVVAGGETSVDQMIASTEKGLLVTRLWYIREVDPYQKIMTGMTRDGTFLIENGEITGGVRNFRFNQSLVELLSNVESLSPPVRTSPSSPDRLRKRHGK